MHVESKYIVIYTQIVKYNARIIRAFEIVIPMYAKWLSYDNELIIQIHTF